MPIFASTDDLNSVSNNLDGEIEVLTDKNRDHYSNPDGGATEILSTYPNSYGKKYVAIVSPTNLSTETKNSFNTETRPGDVYYVVEDV